MKYKTCACFGHRNATLTDTQVKRLAVYIEDLIVNHNVNAFLFGSRSDFDVMCYKIITELKEKYPYIIRKRYTCRNEICILESERKRWENICSSIMNEKVDLLGVEEEVEYKTKWISGKASYVKRNQVMIDDSDYCIFYYDKNYKPQARKYYKKSINYYQPNSGTELACNYAERKKKIIMNIFNITV